MLSLCGGKQNPPKKTTKKKTQQNPLKTAARCDLPRRARPHTFRLRRLEDYKTNLKLETTPLACGENTLWPATFFIINERLCEPPVRRDAVLCSPPHSEPWCRTLFFPTLSFPSTCQSGIMIEAGWQAGSQPSAMKARPHSLPLPPPFHAHLPPEVPPPRRPPSIYCPTALSAPPSSSMEVAPVVSAGQTPSKHGCGESGGKAASLRARHH